MISSGSAHGSSSRRYTHHASFILSYLLFGLLHELSHVAIAHLFHTPSSVDSDRPFEIGAALHHVTTFVARALLGRYCLIELPIGSIEEDGVSSDVAQLQLVIRHFGWIFSLILATALHSYYIYAHHSSSHDNGSVDSKQKSSLWFKLEPIVIAAAYVTALEALTTDLLGFVPQLGDQQHDESSTTLPFFCGNFGILLLNSSWINIDGGKKALDMLEKMVEVTMMRGAQSGGVVTFEPADKKFESNSAIQAPIIRGIRSRVVNAKRTVLSKGVRSKIEKDNCSRIGNNLSGWNGKAFNPNTSGKHLVRGFFGHTRFATSSKATMDGTHPHQWSPRRFYTFFPFQSAAAATAIGGDTLGETMKTTGRRATGTGLGDPSSDADKNVMHLAPKSQSIGVENFVTHNGDFEYFKINGKYYDTEAIQQWLTKALQVAMPATVDSAAIAGMMDLLRCQGCFALSSRYAVCFKMRDGSIDVNPMDPSIEYPSVWNYEEIGKVFEKCLNDYVQEKGIKSLEYISSSEELREELVSKVKGEVVSLSSSKTLQRGVQSALNVLTKFVSTDIEQGDLGRFVRATVDAFFDNDLLHSMRTFLENAKGSFGLCLTTSMDAHRQVVFAAKGQTTSVAFYPRKGVVCFGSEQAAVKAGLNYETPQGKSMFGTDFKYVDENAVRLDLDDLGGEICLLDWGYGGDNEPAISPPNRNLAVDKLMGGAINVILLHQENVMSKSAQLKKRLVQLENNEFIKPLLDDCDDPVLADIRDIPRICANIQDDWHDVGLNRMTAWHLGQCIRHRLQGRVDGTVEPLTNQVDILVTGCEVSLWVAEQFVADLQKCFPRMGIKAVSSNKLLGMFGQELSMPAIGFPYTDRTLDLKDPIVIIVSHSGGTFGPLACSNLMQSFTSSIFTVTSEWDTQVGKQLRSMYGDKNDLLTSRIFSTEVGVRPAEPCSVSVAATHQLLTNIFEHVCMTIISNPHFRSISGAIITERDLQTLERCNRENIVALGRIVGSENQSYKNHKEKCMEEELRSAGDLWAEHILENAKAYMMTFVYIIVTVTIGHPLISGITFAAGLRTDSSPGDRVFYLTRFLDALIYFWLPQINIFIIRLIQGRNLRHRMIGRTVIVGDPCPWVAQCGEAFLGKIFACSYSIAGLNVLSGNPADHLVHRHTHRVVRGSLLVCGRPDGRLTALTTLEASTCLAVNQASSIQSIGGTCESITIGHNMSELPLSHKGIFLETHRPQFLCEKLLEDSDTGGLENSMHKPKPMALTATGNLRSGTTSFLSQSFIDADAETLHKLSSLQDSFNDDSTISNKQSVIRSSIAEEEDSSSEDEFLQSLMSINEGNGTLDDSILKPEDGLDDSNNDSFLSVSSNRMKKRITGLTKLRNSIQRGSSNHDDEIDIEQCSGQGPTGQESQGKAQRGRSRNPRRGASNVSSNSTESKNRSTASLLGAYSNMEKEAKEKATKQGVRATHHLGTVIEDMIKERRGDDRAIKIFNEMDVNGNGCIEFSEFVVAYMKLNPDVSMVQLEALFEESDLDGDGTLDLDEFIKMSKMPHVDILGKLNVVNRDSRGLAQVMPSTEKYFGEELKKSAPKGVGAFIMSQSQHLAMELYESRIASMQRFVAMTVMFHQMGLRVESFFPKISFGLLGYRKDRTHSIMRIATTASPVSGADVRARMMELHLRFKIQKAVNLVASHYKEWKRSGKITSNPNVSENGDNGEVSDLGVSERRKSA